MDVNDDIISKKMKGKESAGRIEEERRFSFVNKTKVLCLK